jgi:hypothetical protein
VTWITRCETYQSPSEKSRNISVDRKIAAT